MPDREVELERRLEERMLAALAEFAAGAGHELNNPLAIISGRAQLLLAAETDPQRRSELATIQAQAARAHEMIADLMLFARPPAPRRERLDAAAWLSRAIEPARRRAHGQGAELAVEAPAEPVWVEADPAQLAVALLALVDNALEAVGKPGRVEVALRAAAPAVAPNDEPAGGVRITVADDGPGIPPEVRPHIFEPFYSGRSSGRGLGMGLAKCWRIVTLHGGRIDVASGPPRRTTFTIHLPAAGS